MSDLENLRAILHALRWSPEEADVYVHLIGTGSVTAAALSRQLDMDPRKAGSLLRSLKDKGGVKIANSGEGGKITYAAENPQSLLEVKLSKLETLRRAAVDEAAEHWEAQQVDGKRLADAAINSEDGIHAAMDSALKGATRRIFIMDASMRWMNKGAAALLQQKNRKVDVRILTTPEATRLSLLTQKNVPVRYPNSPNVTFLVADDIVVIPQVAVESAVQTENPGLADLLSATFEDLWQESNGDPPK